MRAMILAAGYGSRLRPLTSLLPKPLVPVANRPLLSYIIRSIRAAGIRELVINLHYRGEQIRQWLGGGEALGVEVTYSEEADLLGSAGGARHVRTFFGDHPALIVHGDLLFDVDLRAVIEYHLSRQAQVTLVLHPAHDRFNYGTIKVNPRGEIAQFVNQQAPWVSGSLMPTVFTGVQILDPDLLATIPAHQVSMLTTDLYPRLLSPSSRMFGYLMHGYWSDLGTPLRYWEANLDLLGGRVRPAGSHAGLDAGARERLGGQGLAGSRVHPPVTLGEATCVGAGCTLGPSAVIGERCRIQDGARVVQSVLWPRVRVGARASIERSIVLSDVTIPDGAEVIGTIVSLSGVEPL